jgi:hypothetical protein
MLPIKRKSPQAGPGGLLSVSPAPPPQPASAARMHQRASCGPTCSSPAVGGWASHPHAASEGCREDVEMDSCHMADSARGKAQRVCSQADGGSTECGGAPAGCPAAASPGASGGAGPMEMDCVPQGCPPSAAHQRPVLLSLPPALSRSYHSGCCSRLSSASPLTELEAASVASAAAESVMAGAAAVSAEGGASAAVAAGPANCWPSASQLAMQAAGRCSSGGGGQQQPQPQQQWAFHQQQQQYLQQQLGGGALELSYWADMPDDILKRVSRQAGSRQAVGIQFACASSFTCRMGRKHRGGHGRRCVPAGCAAALC